VPNVRLIQSIKFHNIKREKRVNRPKEEEDMIENSQDTEDRLNPSSERKLKQPRRLPFVCNAPSAREEE
jgi:hypothetical protein